MSEIQIFRCEVCDRDFSQELNPIFRAFRKSTKQPLACATCSEERRLKIQYPCRKDVVLNGVRTRYFWNGQADVPVKQSSVTAIGCVSYDFQSERWKFSIRQGGVTGYESFWWEDSEHAREGWAACAGCSRWDRLWFPSSEMRRALDECAQHIASTEICCG